MQRNKLQYKQQHKPYNLTANFLNAAYAENTTLTRTHFGTHIVTAVLTTLLVISELTDGIAHQDTIVLRSITWHG